MTIAGVNVRVDAVVDGQVRFEGEGPVGVGHLVPGHPGVGTSIVDQDVNRPNSCEDLRWPRILTSLGFVRSALRLTVAAVWPVGV